MNNASALGNGIEVRARWSLRLFGGFELGALPGGERVALPGKRERVLLAHLALSPNCRQPRRKLATLLWGDATDETALDNLRTCVWSLRKAFGDTEHRVIASEGDDIVLDAAAFEVDALAFRRLAAQSGLTELEAAANLCSGEFLDGFDIESEEFESWRRGEAARYRDQTIDVLTRLMALLGECGETQRAIETGVRILGLEPLHEAAVRRLMQLYGESGRRGAAVQLYRMFADALRTELDAEPEAETRLVFAEIARRGEERTSDPAAPEAKLPPRSSRMARPSDASGGPTTSLVVLAGAAIVAAALFSYWQFAGSVPNSSKAAVAERTAPTPQAGAISIVVLPLANLSGDASQDFFSDGMTEEITSALAKIASLRVVARTSAFQFKGQNLDVRMIARSLGASHLIEGSVRKIGNRVRISAELIEAASGTNLWTESYEREFTDIFAIQEGIAQAIAGALRVPLGLKQGDTLVRNQTKDLDSYLQYLRAKALVRARGLTRMTEAAALLEEVVSRDPEFAPGWALLAQAYEFTPTFHPARNSSAVEEYRRVVDASLPRAEAAAQRAIQLDPNNADGYLALGYVQAVRGKWLVAEELYSKARAFDPNNSDALHLYGLLLVEVGHVREALAMRQRLEAQEPFVPVFNSITGLVLWLNGQNDAAIAMLKDIPAGGGGEGPLAMIYAEAGRYREAADALLPIPTALFLPGTVEDAGRLLRTAPAKVASPQALPQLGNLGFVYLYVGATDRTLEFYDGNAKAGFFLGGIISPLWHRSYAPVRKTERFKAYIRAAGMIDYWRARGWPDLCHPVGADDFVCN
ncbi:MAG TPA: BTAD domain-containing putative transcriptional regulator [Micropepsaceae bacterium]|nr:BTAD domain-containing putative transcriptional regulator [Micropepsaceae bacterium]